MSDYSNTYGGAAKDSAQATILAADIDTELDSLSTHSATKTNKIVSPDAGKAVSMTSTGDLQEAADLLLEESADHTSTPSAGKGIIWIKNDTPNTVVFTDDAGTDHDLIAPVFSVSKGIDQTINNSSTLQDDDDLLFTTISNSIYEVDLLITIFAANAIPDFKGSFSLPASATFEGVGLLGGGTSTSVQDWVWGSGTGYPTAVVNGGTITKYWLKGVLITSGTGGLVTFRWAQFLAHASDTSVQAGSYLSVTKIS